MLTLYDYFRSSASFRVRIALNYKELNYETVPIHLVNDGGEQHSEAYQQINPYELVPSLIEDQHTLTQSIAIIEYLEETHPTPALLPSDAHDRATVRAIALAISADIHPLNNLRVLQYLTKELHASEEQKHQWYHHWIAKGFQGLERQLATTNKNGQYCFKDQFTIADVCLIPQMYNAIRFNCPLDDYPILNSIYQNCKNLTAVTLAWPEETVN